MSPRLLASPGRSATAADDVYSAGCMLFYMLFRRHPFEMARHESFDEWLARVPAQQLSWPLDGMLLHAANACCFMDCINDTFLLLYSVLNFGT